MTTCRTCVMDDSDPAITFDEYGDCNHCRGWFERAKRELHSQADLDRIVSLIQKEGRHKEYDCVIGLSGGLDSSYVALKVTELGLNPLAISVDNEFDTEIAKHNVKALVSSLGLTHEVIKLDMEQYKDIQLSFLKAGVMNIEIPTDHAITATLYRKAAEIGTRWVLTGGNVQTEGIMPDSWGYDAKDWKHIETIQKKFGSESLKGFPRLTMFDWVWFTFWKGIKFFPILNYVPYVQNRAIEELKEFCGWKDYGDKHMESVYTRFFQGFILPRRYGIDKRKAHYSTLICSGQMTRTLALQKLGHPYYPDDDSFMDMVRIADYFNLPLWKLRLLLTSPKVPHETYGVSKWWKRLTPIVRYARKVAIAN